MNNLGDSAPGGGRYIPLNRGYIAIVDDEDFEHLSKRKWTTLFHKCGVYARTTTSNQPKPWSPLQMHRVIMNAAKGEYVDHRDGNGLNNRRSNLRVCTNRENCRNQKKTYGSSRFKGVSIHRCGRWQAAISDGARVRYLGLFATQDDAARVYDQAARELYGSFAAVNFPSHAGERCCLAPVTNQPPINLTE